MYPQDAFSAKKCVLKDPRKHLNASGENQGQLMPKIDFELCACLKQLELMLNNWRKHAIAIPLNVWLFFCS